VLLLSRVGATGVAPREKIGQFIRASASVFPVGSPYDQPGETELCNSYAITIAHATLIDTASVVDNKNVGSNRSIECLEEALWCSVVLHGTTQPAQRISLFKGRISGDQA